MEVSRHLIYQCVADVHETLEVLKSAGTADKLENIYSMTSKKLRFFPLCTRSQGRWADQW